MTSHSNRALLLVLGLFVLGVVFFPGFTPTRPITQRDAQHVMSDLSLDNLEVSLAQASPADTPRLSVSVKNTHPSTTLTLLRWDSPLDPLALQLGLIAVTPAGGASAPLDMPTIQIRRAMPPDAESLVTLRPGESASSVVELRDSFVPRDTWAQGKAKIGMRGSWAAIWPGLRKDDLLGDVERLSALGGGDGVLTGEWESPTVEF
ncbi:hypothetical protein KVR01_007811 [Diaporthe batatas]|uniref:uncharacterized protein n=1 Tax=Diaporthe batatas TaxID=748121 RepID=UPI001D03869B|nr:uncharacterized protein KVR01_007811 [Diaporthe batatas]KAG8162046.1 hypothetical protein KVR01_007811 [Diaporthe batatas]